MGVGNVGDVRDERAGAEVADSELGEVVAGRIAEGRDSVGGILGRGKEDLVAVEYEGKEGLFGNCGAEILVGIDAEPVGFAVGTLVSPALRTSAEFEIDGRSGGILEVDVIGVPVGIPSVHDGVEHAVGSGGNERLLEGLEELEGKVAV